MRGGASVCMERGISARRRYAALRVARTGALDERGHGGGDHPVPFRTRQLSPPSPDVLRGKPVGGRAAALAQRARTRAPAHRRPRHARGPLLFSARAFRRIGGPAPRGAFLVPSPDRRFSSAFPPLPMQDSIGSTQDLEQRKYIPLSGAYYTLRRKRDAYWRRFVAKTEGVA